MKGDGKELCDLLVVFQNHVVIFSDKNYIFTKNDDIRISWGRWYKKAIQGAAKQIFGAERWLFKYPDSIFLDSKCAQSFPFQIPKQDDAVVHRIVISQGASDDCREYWGGTGSLVLDSRIIGDAHLNRDDCVPFTVGQINPDKGFVHIFDDVTLGIVMQTLDTVSDFITYLTKKELFFRDNEEVVVLGEENLLASYLSNMNDDNEHWFLQNSFDTKEITGIVFLDDHWESFYNNRLRIAQLEANRISYMWDELVEKFIYHVTTGTSAYLSHPNIREQSLMFQILAKENRTKRRYLAQAFMTALQEALQNNKFTRTIVPKTNNEPYYLFLILSHNKSCSDDTQYRAVRRDVLEKYLYLTKNRYPDAKDIVGIAINSLSDDSCSEDIMHLDAQIWTDEDALRAKDSEKWLNDMGLIGKRKMHTSTVSEYPDKKNQFSNVVKGSDRNKPCLCGSGKKHKRCCAT